MATPKYTLTDYGPIYAICPEVRIPEDMVRQQALRWLLNTSCKNGETPKLNDKWIKEHVEEERINTVDDLLIFIRYNMYRDNREAQQLADQDVICAKLAERLVEDMPQELIDEAINSSLWRFEDALRRNGQDMDTYCKQQGKSRNQVEEEVRTRALQSIKEDSALTAYAEHENLTLDVEDIYAAIPGDSIEDKMHKRQQMEREGRGPALEKYALQIKALNTVMDSAMIKRRESDEEWFSYSGISQAVQQAYQAHPDGFVTM